MNPIDENTIKQCNDCASKGLKYSQNNGRAQVTISEDYMQEAHNGMTYMQQASALAEMMAKGEFGTDVAASSMMPEAHAVHPQVRSTDVRQTDDTNIGYPDGSPFGQQFTLAETNDALLVPVQQSPMQFTTWGPPSVPDDLLKHAKKALERVLRGDYIELKSPAKEWLEAMVAVLRARGLSPKSKTDLWRELREAKALVAPSEPQTWSGDGTCVTQKYYSVGPYKATQFFEIVLWSSGSFRQQKGYDIADHPKEAQDELTRRWDEYTKMCASWGNAFGPQLQNTLTTLLAKFQDAEGYALDDLDVKIEDDVKSLKWLNCTGECKPYWERKGWRIFFANTVMSIRCDRDVPIYPTEPEHGEWANYEHRIVLLWSTFYQVARVLIEVGCR